MHVRFLKTAAKTQSEVIDLKNTIVLNGSKSFVLISALLWVLLGNSQEVAACNEVVSTSAELETALAAAQPGDILCIADGSYNSWRVNIPRSVRGENGKYITIRPQNENGVTFKGSTKFEIYGHFIHLTGMNFDRTPNDSVVLHGNDNRLSHCTFTLCGGSQYTLVVEIRHDQNFKIGEGIGEGGQRNEIDHNIFKQSISMSLGLRVPRSQGDSKRPPHIDWEKIPRDNHIHHNQFLDISPKDPNNPYGCSAGQEAMQIGKNYQTFRKLRTLIEYNVIENFTAHKVAIAFKSSGNILRYNIFRNNYSNANCGGQGVVNLRAGQANTVDGNVFTQNHLALSVSGLNDGQYPQGGEPHTIINNLLIDSGGLDIFLEGHRLTSHALIAHNTIVADNRLIFFRQSQNPRKVTNTFLNNIFVLRNTAATPFATHTGSGRHSLTDILNESVFERNIFFWQDGSTPAIPGPTTGDKANLVVDPQLDLSDPLVPRFLNGNSPAINNGLPSAVSKDIVGQIRIDKLPDIGAFEVAGSLADGTAPSAPKNLQVHQR